jgi:adenylylsulfate kinase
MIILITGLPGSGKTTMAHALGLALPNFYWINGDAMRDAHHDWDFSYQGRRRQAERMASASLMYRPSIVDFVCPKEEFRHIIGADIVVWMNTIKESRYPDTDDIFEPPFCYDYIVREYHEINEIAQLIKDNVRRATERRTYKDVG